MPWRSECEALLEPAALLPPDIVCVVAHPDDEIVGAGGSLLPDFAPVHVIHVTDGAPHAERYAKAAGFASRAEYARARRAEALHALALANIAAEHVQDLGIPDQEASLRLAPLAHALHERLARLRPDVVLTHAYEGGHPDHDATAFAVRAACDLLALDGVRVALWEMTSYHAAGSGAAYAEFLPAAGALEVTIELSADERMRKRRLFDCFVSQQDVLQWFPIERERFRRAPRYDFEQPPHPGRLYYERFDWGMDGARWRTLAAEARAILARA